MCKKTVAPEKGSFTFCIPDNFKDPIPAGDSSAIYGLDGAEPAKLRLSFQYRQSTDPQSETQWLSDLREELASDRRLTLIAFEDFASTAGSRGTRVIYDFHPKSDELSHTLHVYYLFAASGDVKITFNAIVNADDKDGLAIVDAIAKTVTIKK
ncbi:MAG: hypothetical protein ACJ73D_12735 [Pyrinomonadaceae bacterium]